MLSCNKVIEIFYMADDYCFFLMKQLRNIQSKMAKSIDINPITYRQSCRDARAQSRCAVKRNACQTTTDHHTSPVGTAELCRAYSALIGFGSFKQRLRCRSIVCLLSVNPYRVQIHLMKIIT